MHRCRWQYTAWTLVFFLPSWCAAQDDQVTDLPLIEIPESVPIEVEPVVVVRPSLWSGSVEFGVNGASGNSDLLNFRIGGDAKRKSPANILTMDWYYRTATSSGVQSENRGQVQGRLEWPVADTPWSVFTKGSAFYDEFKAFDVRLSLHAGVGYDWINTEITTLKTRLGFGGSWEFGGPNNRFNPEAVIGVDFERKISKRQKLYAAAEFFPGLTSLGDYRVVANAGYELIVNPDWNLTLKIGVNDRYDSSPEGKRRNDIEYYSVLLWKF